MMIDDDGINVIVMLMINDVFGDVITGDPFQALTILLFLLFLRMNVCCDQLIKFSPCRHEVLCLVNLLLFFSSHQIRAHLADLSFLHHHDKICLRDVLYLMGDQHASFLRNFPRNASIKDVLPHVGIDGRQRVVQ